MSSCQLCWRMVVLLDTNSFLQISNSLVIFKNSADFTRVHESFGPLQCSNLVKQCARRRLPVRCSGNATQSLRTCKNCKSQFHPLLNHPRACSYHTAHFGGETKRKFESVYTGGTMDTPDSGRILQYWHCCGSEDPCDPGCTASPHYSYDD